MTTPERPATRRLTITLRRGPWLGIRPTIVIAGRGQPTQWGTGTWQVEAHTDASVAVYLHVRGLTWGRATCTIGSSDGSFLQYRAPWLLFRRGTLEFVTPK